MQVTLNGVDYQIQVGSSVKIKSEIWVGPAGADALYAVTQVVEPNLFFIADPASTAEAPLQDIQFSSDAIAEVDVPSVPPVSVDLGGGIIVQVAPEAAAIIKDQVVLIAALNQEIKDFQSGAAIQQLNATIASLQTQLAFYQGAVVQSQQVIDLKACALGLQNLFAILNAPPPAAK